MTSVQLRQVVKEYDTVEQVTLTGYKLPPALRNVSLEIESGETMCIVGPSGCGKSTLLKVVAGLEYPQRGRVFYGDFDMTDIKPQDRGVGMVFQDYALYPTMKGKGNLSYYFQMHEHTQEEMEARVQHTAQLMGVDFNYLLGRLPDTLSGGEKQRVAIARCIVRDPVVFLMDEP
ncbi:MAG TPA: ABC transporter ATP-binding protein, partial [Ktedonobacteraceae bacterium]|nr:ABC transporter ATP-binding protein [Ktedonobacteraceae bacterium]